MSNGRRKRWVVWSVVVLAIASVAVTIVVVRSLPVVDDEELDEIAAYLVTERAALESVPCERPPLIDDAGQRRTSSTSLLRELFDPRGPFAACIAAVQTEAVSSSLDGRPPERTDGATWRFRVAGTELPVSGMTRGWGALAVQRPLYPRGEEPAALLAVRAACESLPAHLDAIARCPGGCSPFEPVPPAHQPDMLAFVMVAKAIAIVARALAAEGDMHAALSLLLEGVAAMHDVRRGLTYLVVAMVALAAEGILFSHFQTLLVADSNLDAESSHALERALDRLATSVPHPSVALRADWLALEEAYFLNRPRSDLDDSARLRMYVLPLLSAGAKRGCPMDGSWTECLAGYGPTPPVEVDPNLRSVLGERVLRSWIARDIVAANRPQLAGYVRGLMQSLAWITGAKILLALERLRREGVCPDRARLDSALLTIPLLGQPMTVHRLRVQEFEIHAPAILHDTPGPLPLMLTACPAVGGEWSTSP